MLVVQNYTGGSQLVMSKAIHVGDTKNNVQCSILTKFKSECSSAISIHLTNEPRRSMGNTSWGI